MSRANCALYVDANQRYCCIRKVFRVGKAHASGFTVVLANTGPVDLLVFPTGDTDEVSTVHSTLEEGSTTILDAGTYMLDLDCSALDGTDAPADVAAQMSACCEPIGDEFSEAAFICQKFEELFSGTIDIGDVNIDVASIEALKECLTSDEGSAIEKLCSISDILNVVLGEKPADDSGETATYTNINNTTDIVTSVGTGEIKWVFTEDPADLQPDAVAITDFIVDCVAAGNTVDLTWTDVDGNEGSMTVNAVDGAAPDYLFTAEGDVIGDGVKVFTATATCNVEAGEPTPVLSTFDACVVAAIEENTAVLSDFFNMEC